MFTQDYMLNSIYVKGEVSNCKYHTSGHIYFPLFIRVVFHPFVCSLTMRSISGIFCAICCAFFSLKDESGTIACVMFAGQRGGLAFRMSEGQQVVVLGAWVNMFLM